MWCKKGFGSLFIYIIYKSKEQLNSALDYIRVAFEMVVNERIQIQNKDAGTRIT